MLECYFNNFFHFFIQYLPIDQSPIEGFYVSYKPYDSLQDFTKDPVIGNNMREHMISGLSPDSEYSIKIQAFNAAGESDFSNSVVKRTLGRNIDNYYSII